MNNQRTILITAYAVNPYKGSEDGTGWNIPFELAHLNKIIVITRKNNRKEIERFYQENPELDNLKNLSFHYYDLPTWLVFWKKKIGERGYVLYFYLWQLFMPLFIKRIGESFDIVHALNFHSDSHPQFLWLLRKPVFWGPIGHHPPVPKEFLTKNYPIRTLWKDRLYNSVKFVMRTFDPFYHISKWSAKKIFVINSKVNDAVKANKEKIIVLPAVATKSITSEKTESKIFNIISVGRFTYMKGFDLIIESFSEFISSIPEKDQSKVRLTLIGKGEEKASLVKLIKKFGLEKVVEIIDWVAKSDMEKIYLKASIFAFASHEGAGMVVPEALSYGLPVVCFNNEGPGELCSNTNAIKVKVSDYQRSSRDFTAAYLDLYTNESKRRLMSADANAYAKSRFSWSVKADQINNAYDSIVSESEFSLNPIKTK
jgi:glycosyltransferase involved in cell wall biosynthesis